MVEFRTHEDISKWEPKEVMVLRTGEEIQVTKTFGTFNVTNLINHKGKTSHLITLKKGMRGRVIGLSSRTSLSNTYVVKFGSKYVYIYDYNFKKREVISLDKYEE